MASSIYRILVITLLFFGCATLADSQESNKPLTESELLALIGGNALSENVVHEIESRGLAFHPTDAYRSHLTTAGADTHVLTALNIAKNGILTGSAESKSSSELLQHLAMAGKLMRNKQYQKAAEELNGALQSNGSVEAGFIMGELLKVQEQWPRAASVYEQVLKLDPDFPEVHTKLSYLNYRLGDPEQALREARAALARTPGNAEARKNAGAALESAHKFDAAIVEYKEALRIKPDYEIVHYDLGLLLYIKGDLDGSIAEYKKALILNPNDMEAHFNLGISFKRKGDVSSAIREFREAKRIDPSQLEVRQSLGSALIAGNFNAEAIIEFRKLEAMAPDFELCHLCLGIALHRTWDLHGAEKEFRKAADLDPSDPRPLVSLGDVLDSQKKPDEALEAYRLAEGVDENSSDAHRNAGRVLIAKKDFASAVVELKQAEDLQPSDALTHDLFGQALLASGKIDAAIAEFNQVLALNPKETEVRIELAAALEKKPDWPASLDQYRRASLASSTIDLGNNVARVISPSPQDQYAAAKLRFDQHIAALKAAGKSAAAAKLESSVAASKADTGITEKVDAAMQAGSNALRQQQWQDAIANYKKAVDLGDKLQPHDGRLAIALGELGRITMGLQNFAEADVIFHRQLKVTEELYGPQSPMLSDPLQNLGMEALAQHDFASAEKFFTRAIELNVAAFGENSTGVSKSLRTLAGMYSFQNDFAKAEPFMLRAVKIDETLYGRDGADALPNLTVLCSIYDRWGKPEKTAPCQDHLLAILEKQYGPDNPILVSTLAGEAKALRSLGRNDEATMIDQRIKTIQATAPNQN